MPPQAAIEDYYAILEVERSALHEDIVNSYRPLALRLHPDRNYALNATAAFQQVSHAQAQSRS
jgi:curved DNA-binding protein CbpA